MPSASTRSPSATINRNWLELKPGLGFEEIVDDHAINRNWLELKLRDHVEHEREALPLIATGWN